MTDPYPVPVNALFGSDFTTQLVLLVSSDTVAEAASKIAYHTVGRRIPERQADLAMYVEGRPLPPHLTLDAAGVNPLEFVFVDFVDAEGASR